MLLRLSGAAGARGVRNEFERIGGARVLGLRVVIEVANAGIRIEHDVLQHGAEAFGRGVDFRLGLGREPDALGVTAALEIEHALRAPAVLVVADQRALGIGRQRRLAGAGEAEEQRNVARRADIRRAVHRHHAIGRQIVIERREHRFLHLAGIRGAADQDDAPAEVDRDDGLAAHAMAFRIGLERRQRQDGEIRHVVRKLGALRPDQQRADEQRVPGDLVIDARPDAVSGIGAAVEILRIQGLALGVGDEIVEQQLEFLGREAAIPLPPHRFLSLCVGDDEFVLGTAAGMRAGLGAERAALNEVAFAVGDRVLD